jgi:glycosyltransferase involved in cell wall biosynthesis
VYDPRSIGVSKYVERLAAALAELGVAYRPTARPLRTDTSHFHLANSTRRVVPYAVRAQRGFLLTVHDVVPRATVLRPLQRALVVPLCVKRAVRVLVHSEHAARMLSELYGLGAAQIEVVPMPAPVPGSRDRRAARLALGLEPDGSPLFVLPGVLKPAKLVAETVTAARPLLARGRVRLLLAGRILDDRLAAEALAAGVQLLRDPGAESYEHAIVAADAVLCLRRDSVGETNAPLLDAIGAGRPSLVTAVGSGPEVAGDAARVVEPTADGIRAGIEALLDQGERDSRAQAANVRAQQFSWAAAARRHRELLQEMSGA